MFARNCRLALGRKTYRCAGGLFASDLSVVLSLDLPDAAKLSLLRHCLSALLRPSFDDGYDLITIMFPLPKKLTDCITSQEAGSDSVLMKEDGKICIYDGQLVIHRVDSAKVLKYSLTAKALTAAPLNAEIFIASGFMPEVSADDLSLSCERCAFLVYVCQPFGLHSLIDSRSFWSKAMASGLADRARLRLLNKMPGQSSRVHERRELAYESAKRQYAILGR